MYNSEFGRISGAGPGGPKTPETGLSAPIPYGISAAIPCAPGGFPDVKQALTVFQAFRAADRRFDKTANFNVVDKQSLSPKTEVLGKPQ
jgi:hypothetical protein